MKYADILSAKHDYGMFNSAIKTIWHIPIGYGLVDTICWSDVRQSSLTVGQLKT